MKRLADVVLFDLPNQDAVIGKIGKVFRSEGMSEFAGEAFGVNLP